MYICNKCGAETHNPDMICDNCKPKKEETKPDLHTKERKKEEEKTIRDERQEENQDEPIRTMNTNLMFCPDCGKKISRNALQCPHCGCPFDKNKEQKVEEIEKILLKDNGVKAVSYITTVVGYLLSSVIFGIGCLIPLCWLIYLCVYVSGKDGRQYDLSWYIKLRNEFIILTILGLPIIVFL